MAQAGFESTFSDCKSHTLATRQTQPYKAQNVLWQILLLTFVWKRKVLEQSLSAGNRPTSEGSDKFVRSVASEILLWCKRYLQLGVDILIVSFLWKNRNYTPTVGWEVSYILPSSRFGLASLCRWKPLAFSDLLGHQGINLLLQRMPLLCSGSSWKTWIEYYCQFTAFWEKDAVP